MTPTHDGCIKIGDAKPAYIYKLLTNLAVCI
jgi:hypothetical protein